MKCKRHGESRRGTNRTATGTVAMVDSMVDGAEHGQRIGKIGKQRSRTAIALLIILFSFGIFFLKFADNHRLPS